MSNDIQMYVSVFCSLGGTGLAFYFVKRLVSEFDNFRSETKKDFQLIRDDFKKDVVGLRFDANDIKQSAIIIDKNLSKQNNEAMLSQKDLEHNLSRINEVLKMMEMSAQSFKNVLVALIKKSGRQDTDIETLRVKVDEVHTFVTSKKKD